MKGGIENLFLYLTFAFYLVGRPKKKIIFFCPKIWIIEKLVLSLHHQLTKKYKTMSIYACKFKIKKVLDGRCAASRACMAFDGVFFNTLGGLVHLHDPIMAAFVAIETATAFNRKLQEMYGEKDTYNSLTEVPEILFEKKIGDVTETLYLGYTSRSGKQYQIKITNDGFSTARLVIYVPENSTLIHELSALSIRDGNGEPKLAEPIEDWGVYA